MHRRRFLSTSLLFIAITTLALQSKIAHAEPKAQNAIKLTGQDRPEKQTPISNEDIAAAKTTMGLSATELAEKFIGQADFNRVAGAIESSDPAYVSAIWNGGKGPKGLISFAGSPAPASLDAMKGLPFVVQYKTDEKLSAVQQQAALESAHAQLASLPGVSNATGYINHRESSIELQYSTEETASRLSTQSAIAGTAVSSPMNVMISLVESGRSGPEIGRGGESMGGCTSSFVVRTGSGSVLQLGILTVYNREHRGSYGDFQIHDMPQPYGVTSAIKISSSGATRAITSQGVASVGTLVCNYGKTRTSEGCGRVNNTSACALVDGVQNCRLVTTDGTFTNPGDSGGPWYVGNAAAGIHFGKINGMSSYSRIGNAEAILGVQLTYGSWM